MLQLYVSPPSSHPFLNHKNDWVLTVSADCSCDIKRQANRLILTRNNERAFPRARANERVMMMMTTEPPRHEHDTYIYTYTILSGETTHSLTIRRTKSHFLYTNFRNIQLNLLDHERMVHQNTCTTRWQVLQSTRTISFLCFLSPSSDWKRKGDWEKSCALYPSNFLRRFFYIL